MAATATERAADYHQDPGETPTLSSTIARLLLSSTPAHAKARHPRLSDYPLPASTRAMTTGTAVHQILLRDDRIDVIEVNDFKSKAAREARDATLADGRVPISRPMWDEAETIAGRVLEQMAGLNVKPTPFTAGQAEHVIRFVDSGAQCRSMLDWLRDDRATIDDLKTTGLTADPAQWGRKLFKTGFDVQAAFYVRAVEAAYGVTPTFRWVVVETKPPYPVSVVQLTERAMESARVKVDAAISIWNECLASGVWPAYSADVFEADVPGWMADEADRWSEVDLVDVPF